MGWLTFSVERDAGFSEVESRLAEIRGKMGDVSDLLKQIAAIYKDSTIKRFSSHTDPKGRAWKRLQKRTVLVKTKGWGKRGPSVAPPSHQLIWTGKLRGAIKVRFQKREKLIQIGVSLGEVPYARLHQFGSGNTDTNNVPARPWLGTTKLANRQALAAMTAFFELSKK